jgi:5-methylcytosine-specific restriction endonuclease McrA
MCAVDHTAQMRDAKQVGARSLRAILNAQRFRCALSGRLLAPETASIDHRIPIVRGGGHGSDNVWLVDHVVNSAKGTMTAEEFIALCYEVVRHDRRRRRPRSDRQSTQAKTLFDAVTSCPPSS